MIKSVELQPPLTIMSASFDCVARKVEANFNRHLDEARIKAMTGGEPITARFMRQNFFQFAPVFKLWLVANDRPKVTSRHPPNHLVTAWRSRALRWRRAAFLRMLRSGRSGSCGSSPNILVRSRR